MNMVEKVAKALQELVNSNWEDGEITTHEQASRAAIEVMRTPTDRMADDGYRAMHYGADAVWKAMIEAALSE